MTSSKQTLKDLLFQNDFAEVAEELQQKKLLDDKRAKEKIERELEHKRELERLAAMPKITDEDVQKAEQLGYERGVQEGRLQAENALREEFESNIQSMRIQFEKFEPLLQKHVAQVEKNSLNFLKDVLKLTLKHASEHYSEELFKMAIEEALSKSDKEKELHIALSPASRFYLEDMQKDLFKGLNVKLYEDETLEKGDCIITWGQQGVSARLSKVTSELEKIISAAAQGIKPEDVELDFIIEETAQEAEKQMSETPAPIETTGETLISDTETLQSDAQTNSSAENIEENAGEDVTTTPKNETTDPA